MKVVQTVADQIGGFTPQPKPRADRRLLARSDRSEKHSSSAWTGVAHVATYGYWFIPALAKKLDTFRDAHGFIALFEPRIECCHVDRAALP